MSVYLHGRRPRGRPRKRWLDNIAEDCEALNLTIQQASRLANDRVKWRNTVRDKGCRSAGTSSSSQRRQVKKSQVKFLANINNLAISAVQCQNIANANLMISAAVFYSIISGSAVSYGIWLEIEVHKIHKVEKSTYFVLPGTGNQLRCQEA